jgi:hypothetical protein
MALTMEQVQAEVLAAGKKTADGADGIMYLAKITHHATRAGLISTKKGDDSIQSLYVEYLKEANKSKFGSKVDVTNVDALKFGVSKLRAFAHFGGLAGKTDANWSLVQRSVAIINRRAADEKKTGSRYEQVLRVIRFANKSKRANLKDAEIEAALTPAEKEVDEMLVALESIAKKARKFADSDVALAALASDYFERIAREAEEQVKLYKAAKGIASDDNDEDGSLTPDDSDEGVDDPRTETDALAA